MNKKIMCYVHNLSYEFDFLIKNVSMPGKIMTNSTHNIISGSLLKYPNIQFMCTYQLSGYALRDIGKMVGLPKLESDYRNYYPEEEIDETDKQYCDRDCDIVAKYIVDVMLPEFYSLKEIPYTKTGRVRKKLKALYAAYVKKNGKPDWDLMPDEQCYAAMKAAFSGGVVLSNIFTTNVILRNLHCYDITSSYPYAMLKEEFPYCIERDYNITEDCLTKHKFWIAKIRFNNISSKFNWQWLSISKMQGFDFQARFFNGKLMNAKYIERTITSVDFETIKLTYDFTDYEILEFYPCKKYGKIPEPYVDLLLEIAEKKHALKGKKKELEKQGLDDTNELYRNVCRDYMLAKNDFNSIYGMLVQDLVQKEFYVDELCAWHEKETKYEQKFGVHLGRNYLFGVFVTAYARRNILRAAVVNCPDTLSYIDTDSLKFFGDVDFVQTNEPLDERFLAIEAVADLGHFDYEGEYEEFKTLGAKKYAYVEGGVVRLTVAGLPKQKSANKFYCKTIDDFYPGRVFENCKLGKKYVCGSTLFEYDEDERRTINVHECEEVIEFCRSHGIVTGGGVALYPTSYKLDMTRNDKTIIEQYEPLREGWIKHLNRKYNTDFRRNFG